MSGLNFLILSAVLVGILGGLAGAALKLLTHSIEGFLHNLKWDYKYYLYLIFPMIGTLLTVLYVKMFIRKSTFEHGLSQLLRKISKGNSKIPFHNIYSQIITSALTVGFGGSAGLEAPIAVSGAAIGSNTGSFMGLNYRDRTMLLACGAAAGIAGVFNSPVAGMVLAIELLLPEFSIPAFIPLLISAAISAVVAQLIYSEPLFVLISEGWKFNALFYYVVLGILSGFFAIYFTKLTFLMHRLFERFRQKFKKALVGSLLLGLFIALFPTLYGEGYITIQHLLNGNYENLLQASFFSSYSTSELALVIFAVLTLFAKSFAALLTVNAGGNGGSFGPSLVMGGLLGFAFAFACNHFFGTRLNITNFIVVGMAAALSGIMHAPLTGIFLIAEITGGYKLMVPLMIVSAISYYINKRNSKYSIYTKMLAEKGDLLTMEDKDRSVLHRMRVHQLLETDFLAFKAEDTIEQKSRAIIYSKRNIFPILTEDDQLLGVVMSDQLLEKLVSGKEDDRHKKIGDLAQPAPDFVYIDTEMYEVMQKMERKDLRMLPVLDREKRFLGFVSKHAIFNRYRQLLKKQLEYVVS